MACPAETTWFQGGLAPGALVAIAASGMWAMLAGDLHHFARVPDMAALPRPETREFAEALSWVRCFVVRHDDTVCVVLRDMSV
jgi:hypothetical protein